MDMRTYGCEWRSVLYGLMLLGLVACQNDDSLSKKDFLESQANSLFKDMPEIVIDKTSLSESETIPETSDASYGDYVESTQFARTVYITYTDDDVLIEGDTKGNVRNSGAHVTVSSTASEFVSYVLSGSSEDGSFKIYSSRKFCLTLNGLNLSNPQGAAINSQCGKTMYLISADGTENTLADGVEYTQTPRGEDEKGALFSEGQIVLSGTGALNVLAKGKNGICSDDYIRIRPNTNVYVNATKGHGIKAKDSLFINGGVINVEASADGAKAMNCSGKTYIFGGRTTLVTTGSTLIEGTDTTSCSALKSDGVLKITGGTLYAKSTGEGGKGINCDQNILFMGGKLVAEALGEREFAAPKAVKSDEELIVSDGDFNAWSKNSKVCDDKDGVITVEGLPAVNTQLKYKVIISY